MERTWSWLPRWWLRTNGEDEDDDLVPARYFRNGTWAGPGWFRGVGLDYALGPSWVIPICIKSSFSYFLFIFCFYFWFEFTFEFMSIFEGFGLFEFY
jgi:hypothetical protein